MASQSTSSGTSVQIENVLQFLLQLAFWQDQFYSPNPALGYLSTVGEAVAFAQIQKQEKEQIIFLQTTIQSLGFTPMAANAQYNFQAVNTQNQTGLFPYYLSDYNTFLNIAQLIEDTVVKAYIGQINNLFGNNQLINQVCGMMTLHARQSAFIRTIRGNISANSNIYSVTQQSLSESSPIPLKPWLTQSDIIAAGTPFSVNTTVNGVSQTLYTLAVPTLPYNGNGGSDIGESNTVQANINIINLNNQTSITSDVATESFDEPLSQATTLNIVNSFLPLPATF